MVYYYSTMGLMMTYLFSVINVKSIEATSFILIIQNRFGYQKEMDSNMVIK